MEKTTTVVDKYIKYTKKNIEQTNKQATTKKNNKTKHHSNRRHIQQTNKIEHKENKWYLFE